MTDWVGNKNSIFKTLGASNHTDNERPPDDYYATDPIAIDKLLSVYTPPLWIWECACGEGHLAKRLSEHGYHVYSSDITDRGYGVAGVDFLKQQTTNEFFNCILTNPPYKYATEFVLHALELLPPNGACIMFLKTTFLEGKARKKRIFDKYPPRYVFQFSERVLCAKNAEFERMKAGGGPAVSYAWFVWEKGFSGETIIKWI